jgi:putative component of toxin-antitoxin plasmid stabilization module
MSATSAWCGTALSFTVDNCLLYMTTTIVAQFIKSSAYAEWIDQLGDRKGRALILARVDRFEATGHPSDVKPVGGRVTEMRIQFGPGYPGI